MMVIFLVGLVSMILMRTLRKDYARYSKDDDLDDMVCDLGCYFSSNRFGPFNLCIHQKSLYSQTVCILKNLCLLKNYSQEV